SLLTGVSRRHRQPKRLRPSRLNVALLLTLAAGIVLTLHGLRLPVEEWIRHLADTFTHFTGACTRARIEYVYSANLSHQRPRRSRALPQQAALGFARPMAIGIATKRGTSASKSATLSSYARPAASTHVCVLCHRGLGSRVVCRQAA